MPKGGPCSIQQRLSARATREGSCGGLWLRRCISSQGLYLAPHVCVRSCSAAWVASEHGAAAASTPGWMSLQLHVQLQPVLLSAVTAAVMGGITVAVTGVVPWLPMVSNAMAVCRGAAKGGTLRQPVCLAHSSTDSGLFFAIHYRWMTELLMGGP